MARVTDSSKRCGAMVYDDTIFIFGFYIYMCVCVCVARGDAPLSSALVKNYSYFERNILLINRSSSHFLQVCASIENLCPDLPDHMKNIGVNPDNINYRRFKFILNCKLLIRPVKLYLVFPF
jgi:hypothetical protein